MITNSGSVPKDSPMPASFMVCVVDDDEPMRESLAGLLRAAGFDALHFGSAEEFWNAPARSRADCLVLDVTMPGMGGAALQERLGQARPRLPVIFITARIDGSLRAKLLQRGAIDCLMKPFDGDELLRAVRTGLSASRRDPA